jgi:hypothetical protein
VIRLRLTNSPLGLKRKPFGKNFAELLARKLREADEFYQSATPSSVSADAAQVMRQAIAGMLWSKQYYHWDGDHWLEEHYAHPLHHGSRDFRNREWFHMINEDIISMPDKWEYPWYAAWDLAFHTLPLAIVDPDFAKEQMELMLRGIYLHPSGQLPAYKWNFSDVNPPVHAWATLFLHRTEQALRGKADVDFLRKAFNKLMLNFTWWVSRKDRFVKNVFEDGFYYDLLRLPDGSATRLKVRSMVGLLPLCATTVIEQWQRERVPQATAAYQARLRQIPELLASIHPTGPGHLGVAERGIIALVNPERLRRILSKMLDENEFLSPYGIRSLSKFHEQHPYIFHVNGQEYRVDYLPGESNTGMFGGNSNWRGPIWMPVNAVVIRALLNFYLYYGDTFKIECPTGSGQMMNLFEVSKEIAQRLTRIFLMDEQGKRPVYGSTEKFQSAPHWRDYILFYEYFHGNNGAGLGASHQTGWTGLVAKFIQLFGFLDPQKLLEAGKGAAFRPEGSGGGVKT